MKCPSCGAANRDDARFCGACGAATSSTEPTNPSLGEAPAMIGREIAGRYRVLAKIGEGGMGAVFRAEQISLKRTVAVKLLRPDVVANPLLLRRFNAEAEAVAKLNHPNTVNIYDFGQDTDGTLFIAMELIEGRSLRGLLQSEAPLPPRRALAIATQVAASLIDAHAHAIVHRDLKPDNVMLQDRGRERDVARVLDFGIAKLRDDSRATQLQMTQQGDMLGTPQYMAPEQIRAEKIDGRADIYALGCLLYEMVTARLPHEATTVLALLSKHLLEHPVPPSQRRPDLGLPSALDQLILGAMAKDPQARPQTMEAFREQIAALLATLPADASAAPAASRSAHVAATPTPGPASGAAQTPSQPSPHGPSPYNPAPAPTPAPYSPAPSAGPYPVPAPHAGAPYPGPHAGAPYPGPHAGSPHPGQPPHAGSPYPGQPPHAGAPYPGPPPHAGAPYPGPPPHAGAPYSAPSASPYGAPHRAPSLSSRKGGMLVLVGAVAVGAVITTAILATRSPGSSPAPDDAAIAQTEDPDDKDPDDKGPDDKGPDDKGPDDKPGRDLRVASDRWASTPSEPTPSEPRPTTPSRADPWAARGPLEGKKVAIGQGVSLIVPPGFRTAAGKGNTIALDDRGIVITAGPIRAQTSDPVQLAKIHAQSNGLVFEEMDSVVVGGRRRPMAIFHGSFGGVELHHVAVALIGPRYRVVVTFQLPASIASNPEIEALAAELYERRIVLP
jgi:serine/threonine protein kinase